MNHLYQYANEHACVKTMFCKKWKNGGPASLRKKCGNISGIRLMKRYNT